MSLTFNTKPLDSKQQKNSLLEIDPLKRKQIRQKIRTARQALSEKEQIKAANQLLEQIKTLPEIQHSNHIALYLSQDSEIDTSPLIHWLWQQNKSVYLPVIHPFSQGQLLFFKYTNQTPLHLNRYKIKEPKLDITQLAPLKSLDLILSPLVAFDNTGQRLGMGGGYYDRTFAYFNGFKIGLAHDCQRIEKVETYGWDQALDKIITPSQVYVGKA